MSVSQGLSIAYFVLMCAGLLLASYFLCYGRIDGGQWVAVCGILFGVDRFASAAACAVGNRS